MTTRTMVLMLLVAGAVAPSVAAIDVPAPVRLVVHVEEHELSQYEDVWFAIGIVSDDFVAHECSAPALGPRGLDVIVRRESRTVVRLAETSLSCAAGSVEAMILAPGMALLTRIRLDGDWFADAGACVVEFVHGGCDGGDLPVRSAEVTINVRSETVADAAARRLIGEWREERQQDRERARTLAELVGMLNREHPDSFHSRQMLVQQALNAASNATSAEARERAAADLGVLLASPWLSRHRTGDVLSSLADLCRRTGADASSIHQRLDEQHPAHVGELRVRSLARATLERAWSSPQE